MNKFRPVKISLENLQVDIPDIIQKIHVNDHPLKKELNDLFYEKELNVLTINSEIIEVFKENKKWNIHELLYDKKQKEKVLLQKINELNKTFNICFINTKFPIWNIFDKVQFDCIIIESEKNRDQMDSILKKKDYLLFNHLYIHKKYLLF